MSQIETVIFDMDGVIIDSEPIHMKIEQELFRELGLNISSEEHHRYVGTSARNMWEEIIEQYRLTVLTDEILKKKQTRYLNHITASDNLNPIPGIPELISRLHSLNKQLILASSATRDEINTILDKFDLESYFSFTISGAELEQSKPDPEIFLTAVKLSRTQKRHCCVIEDSQNGVLAAKAAGVKCIGFRNPSSGNQDLSAADVVIDSFNSIDVEKIFLSQWIHP